MVYSFRQLTSSDISLMKELLYVFSEAFSEPENYQSNIPSDNYLKLLLKKDTFIVITAQNGNKVVGGLAAYVLEKFEQQRKEIFIYDLAVSVKHRRLGIATGLVKKLIQIAREKGAYIIFVQADKGDTPAVRLYESLGTREDVFNFDIKPD